MGERERERRVGGGGGCLFLILWTQQKTTKIRGGVEKRGGVSAL